MEWCKTACGSAETACADLDADVDAARRLRERHPGRVALVRYEDLSLEPYEVVDDLLRFLDLPPSDAVDDYVKSHTKATRSKKGFDPKKGKLVSKVNPYGLYRNSQVITALLNFKLIAFRKSFFFLQAHVFAWKPTMDINYVHRIQRLCQRPMSDLGYAAIPTASERDDPDFPVVVKTRHEVWPWWGDEEDGAIGPGETQAA